jgi:hypothetical protein
MMDCWLSSGCALRASLLPVVDQRLTRLGPLPATLPSSTPGRGPVVTTFSYDGKNGFWNGPYGHWTGSKWIDMDIVAKQLAAAFWAAGVAVAISGADSVWPCGYV